MPLQPSIAHSIVVVHGGSPLIPQKDYALDGCCQQRDTGKEEENLCAIFQSKGLQKFMPYSTAFPEKP